MESNIAVKKGKSYICIEDWKKLGTSFTKGKIYVCHKDRCMYDDFGAEKASVGKLFRLASKEEIKKSNRLGIMEMENILRKLSESVSNECSIYCDDYDFDADDYDFEYTQDDFGNWNDTYEFIKEQNGCCVIAWEWENGFPNESEMGDILPTLISGFATLRYKKGSSEVWEWNTTFEGRECKVLRFRTDENKNGWTYYSFWYLVSFEE